MTEAEVQEAEALLAAEKQGRLLRAKQELDEWCNRNDCEVIGIPRWVQLPTGTFGLTCGISIELNS